MKVHLKQKGRYLFLIEGEVIIQAFASQTIFCKTFEFHCTKEKKSHMITDF